MFSSAKTSACVGVVVLFKLASISRLCRRPQRCAMELRRSGSFSLRSLHMQSDRNNAQNTAPLMLHAVLDLHLNRCSCFDYAPFHRGRMQQAVSTTDSRLYLSNNEEKLAAGPLIHPGRRAVYPHASFVLLVNPDALSHFQFPVNVSCTLRLLSIFHFKTERQETSHPCEWILTTHCTASSHTSSRS